MAILILMISVLWWGRHMQDTEQICHMNKCLSCTSLVSLEQPVLCIPVGPTDTTALTVTHCNVILTCWLQALTTIWELDWFLVVDKSVLRKWVLFQGRAAAEGAPCAEWVPDRPRSLPQHGHPWSLCGWPPHHHCSGVSLTSPRINAHQTVYGAHVDCHHITTV